MYETRIEFLNDTWESYSLPVYYHPLYIASVTLELISCMLNPYTVLYVFFWLVG
jgi:hypothetical protein